ncbi:MAG: 4-hydroxy-3-methylbut-2-enyl diphosphate reductase [Luteibaculaceae bacterium]
MKKFEIPTYYRSPIIGKVKELNKIADPRKKDFSPTLLDFGNVKIYIPRHFGFCYGVENAIEIAYKAIEENPGKRIFLMSQMIHNPAVNADLISKGIQFLMDTEGNPIVDKNTVTKDDVVLIPAFGTTVELENEFNQKGIELEKYNTTCPFVEKVWKRAAKLGEDNFTVIIHGKSTHEETRATFSHSYQNAPSVVVKNMEDVQYIAEIILGNIPQEAFYERFKGKHSEGFDVTTDLQKVGVVNQTTMLATETQALAEYLKQTMIQKHGESAYKHYFADTRDTLCYATNDNQTATYELLKLEADLAFVIGGYNSSNTTHLVELLEEKFPTFFIEDANEMENEFTVNHFNIHTHQRVTTSQYLPKKEPVTIILTSGASCPDTTVDAVLLKLLEFYQAEKSVDEVLAPFLDAQQ